MQALVQLVRAQIPVLGDVTCGLAQLVQPVRGGGRGGEPRQGGVGGLVMREARAASDGWRSHLLRMVSSLTSGELLAICSLTAFSVCVAPPLRLCSFCVETPLTRLRWSVVVFHMSTMEMRLLERLE